MPSALDFRDDAGARGLSLAAAALVGLGGTLAAALVTGVAVAHAVSTFTGLAAIVFVLYHRHGDRPAFGIANVITLLRLGLVGVLVVGLAADGLGPNAWTPGLLALLALALDGLDGHVARRTGRASAFGARFDVEVDAGLLAVSTLLLVAWGKVDALALLLPALRPVFVLAGRAFPWLKRPLPPSGRRKAAGALTGACVLAALLPPVPPELAGAGAAACLAVLAASFATDVARLWRRRRHSVRRLQGFCVAGKPPLTSIGSKRKTLQNRAGGGAAGAPGLRPARLPAPEPISR